MPINCKLKYLDLGWIKSLKKKKNNKIVAGELATDNVRAITSHDNAQYCLWLKLIFLLLDVQTNNLVANVIGKFLYFDYIRFD